MIDWSRPDTEDRRIRNAELTQAPSPELVERMIALIRHAAAASSGYLEIAAKAILAELPQPIDPDEAWAADILERHGYPTRETALDMMVQAIKHGRETA